MATGIPSPPASAATAADALPGRRLPRTLREFLETEAAGGIVLLVAAVTALVWANSPWSASYDALWGTEFRVVLGDWAFEEDLRHVVDEGLMAVFFFVVGLEIKRELVVGELRHRRTASLPAIAALGGMAVPALLYAALNAGGAGARGWGVPMATDIAFALGVVALLGRRVPAPLKLFLLTLAVVDDVGAILVIAVFYSSSIDPLALAGAAAVAAAVVVARRLGVLWPPLYVVLGFALWLATYESGVHATIAGVVLGLLIPAHPSAPDLVARDWVADLAEDPAPEDLRALQRVAGAGISPADRLQLTLHPVTSFVVVPLFALANAGVRVESDALATSGAGAVAAGIVVGLVAGKLIGIVGFGWLAVRLRLGELPPDSSWPQVAGIAAVAGIGFTVSLFVAGLAFPDDPELEAAAKLGTLVASTLAAALGALLLVRAGRQA